MKEDNYKFYKMTSNKPNNYRFGVNIPNDYRFGVLDTKTNIFHYNYINLDFEYFKRIFADTTFEEVPRIVVENHKKKHILAQMNELRRRKDNVSSESAVKLIHF